MTEELEAELAKLPDAHREEALRLLALRERANRLATRLGVDASDVFHQLLHFARTPEERLRMGLAHGRLRPGTHRR